MFGFLITGTLQRDKWLTWNVSTYSDWLYCPFHLLTCTSIWKRKSAFPKSSRIFVLSLAYANTLHTHTPLLKEWWMQPHECTYYWAQEPSTLYCLQCRRPHHEHKQEVWKLYTVSNILQHLAWNISVSEQINMFLVTANQILDLLCQDTKKNKTTELWFFSLIIRPGPIELVQLKS